MVEKGKITKVFKKAYRAGILRTVIVDKSGTKINPREYLDDGSIFEHFMRITPDGGIDIFILFTESNNKTQISDGESTKYSLYPAMYNLDVTFHFQTLGYGSKAFENIQIEKGKTTEIKIILDLNNQTGVYGKIVDQLGQPLDKVKVRICELDKSKKFPVGATVYTDSNGNYRTIGLSEGMYNISFDKRLKPSFDSLTAPDETIFIKTDKMIEMNREVKKR